MSRRTRPRARPPTTAAGAPAIAATGQTATSKTERVYAELRRRIRELVLPPGAPLRKEEIALELHMSRAPVTEAIARLADEALVDVVTRQGSFVAPIRADDVWESLFIRTALELQATRQVAQAADADLLTQLDENMGAQRRAMLEGDLVRFYELDEAFHATLFASVRHPRAQKLLDAARAPLDRPRRLALPKAGRAQATLAEHGRVVDAIRLKDPELAVCAMRSHLTMAARTVAQQLAQITPHTVNLQDPPAQAGARP